MITMNELVIIATLFGVVLTIICVIIALQQGKSIKCLKEISRDMKTHMRLLHEEHKEILCMSKESLEVSKKILTAVTSK